MIGVLTARHVARYAPTVVALFGWRVLGRCALAVILRQRRTFLDIVWR